MPAEKRSQIAFYIGLKNARKTLTHADLRIGNPGVGGTQYLFLLTVKEYNRVYGENQAILLTDGEFGLEDRDVPVAVVETEQGAIRYCEENQIGWLVLNANVLDRLPESDFDTEVRIAAWAHNTLSWKRQLIAARTKSIQRIICVSEKQYENMQDTPCREKCTFINNVIPAEFYNHATVSSHDKPAAVYVGSVMPQKGVHNLLEIWRFVEKSEPTAQLYVFGGANVWNPSAALGSNGAADIYYDRVIQHRLDKLIHPENIHFMGAKGWKDIDKMISGVRVGIVNPSHYMRDETFCMSAIEMEAHEIPIVSRQRGDGLNTTICHGQTGYLEEKDETISQRIIELLHNKNQSIEMGKAARSYARRFTPENELFKWKGIADSAGDCAKSKTVGIKKSRDARLLQHDYILKIGFLIESGKATDLILRKLRRRR